MMIRLILKKILAPVVRDILIEEKRKEAEAMIKSGLVTSILEQCLKSQNLQ